MEIKTISRTISNRLDYSNMSATANIEEGEDITQAFITLDTTLRKAQASIYRNIEKVEHEKKRNQRSYQDT
jgi:Fic family protein